MDPEPFDAAAFVEAAGGAPWVSRVVAHAELDSTNAEALRLAAEGAPEGTVVVADTQTAGRGRLGRSWWSVPGTALLASWIVRPSLPPDRIPLLTLVTGVAAARALGAATGLEVGLKWPNDLLAGGRKLGGILAESDGRGALVVGLGVNVRQEEFPAEIRDSATSVVAMGGRPSARAWLLAATLSGFGARKDDPVAGLEEYRRMCVTLGSAVRVSGAGGEPIEGTASAIGDDGFLVVETASGARRISAGDVVHVRPSG